MSRPAQMCECVLPVSAYVTQPTVASWPYSHWQTSHSFLNNTVTRRPLTFLCLYSTPCDLLRSIANWRLLQVGLHIWKKCKGIRINYVIYNYIASSKSKTSQNKNLNCRISKRKGYEVGPIWENPRNRCSRINTPSWHIGDKPKN